MLWFDGVSGPGWHDYLGLLLTISGFGFAFRSLRKTRNATKAATEALQRAQHDVSRLAFMSILPQVQMVVDDLSYAMPGNDPEVARRALVRFGVLGREASVILGAFLGDHKELSDRLVKASVRATRIKTRLATTASPNVMTIVKGMSIEIDLVQLELAQVGAQMRNRIEGAADVQ